MVYDILKALCDELNNQLKYQTNIAEDVLVLSNLVDMSGAKALQTDNQIHLQLVRIEEDRTLNRAGGFRGLPMESGPRLFHAYVVFAANFSGKQYPLGLDYINRVLNYFVANPILNPSNISDLPSQIDSLTIELKNLEERELSNLWGALGSKLLPHLYYKISLIPVFKESGFERSTPAISGISPNLQRK